MPTPDQIKEQIEHERDAIKCGVEKLMKNTRKSEEREYASSSIYGVSSISAAQEAVANAILDTFRDQIMKGKNGVAFADIKQYLSQFNTPEEANKLANIALKRTFDLVFSLKKKGGSKIPNAIANVSVCIGHSVEQECQIRWYEEKDPELLKKIQKFYWLPTTGTEQKLAVTRLMFNREEKRWDTWSAPVRGRLGGWLLGIVCDVTGWFEKSYIRTSKTNNIPIVEPSQSYLDIQSKLMEEAILFAPLTWPMLVEPNNWTNDKPGGYYLNELMRGNDLVRKGDPTLIRSLKSGRRP